MELDIDSATTTNYEGSEIAAATSAEETSKSYHNDDSTKIAAGEEDQRISHEESVIPKIAHVDHPKGGSASAPAPSKKQLKRLARKAKFEEQKAERRKMRKMKKKESKQKRLDKGIKLEYSRDFLKTKKMTNSSCTVGIVVDLSFDHCMIEKDVHKTVKQVSRCYSVNRRQENPLQFHVTSFTGASAKFMEKHEGFSNWDVYFHQEPYDKLFEKSKIVYLTSDSKNILEEVDPNKFYIIGGLVDHNSRKGLCHMLAESKNIATARLPVEKYVDIKCVKVFSIVHVFEILASVCQGSSWEEAFIKVIPQRKNAELKSNEKQNEDEDDDDGSEEEKDKEEL